MRRTARRLRRARPRLQSKGDREEFGAALDDTLPVIIQHARLLRLEQSLDRLQRALEDAGYDASRVQQVRELVAESTRRLLPKASDEPEAAHPT